MPRRQHEPDRLVAERAHLESARARPVRVVAVARIAERDGEVGAVGAHGGDGLGRLGLDVGDGDARVRGAERGDEPRHERRRRRGERDEPHPPGAQAPDLGELARRGLERGGHGVRVAGEHPARLGEADAAADPLDERDAGALLEASQLLAHRGLAVAERLGRRGERAVLGDLAHHAHGLEVERGRRGPRRRRRT